VEPGDIAKLKRLRNTIARSRWWPGWANAVALLDRIEMAWALDLATSDWEKLNQKLTAVFESLDRTEKVLKERNQIEAAAVRYVSAADAWARTDALEIDEVLAIPIFRTSKELEERNGAFAALRLALRENLPGKEGQTLWASSAVVERLKMLVDRSPWVVSSDQWVDYLHEGIRQLIKDLETEAK